MRRHGVYLMLAVLAIWTGCEKDASDPAPDIIAADTTICKLIKLSSEIPSLPQLNYTVSFTYDSGGRLDSTIVRWVDAHNAIKYHYSVDDHPDSVSVIFTYPPNRVGGGYRVYFGYDSDRRQILTRSSASGSITSYSYNSHGQLARRFRESLINGLPHYDSSRFYYPNSTTHNFNRVPGFGPGPAFLPDTTRYTYDNHPIPLKFPLGAPFPTDFLPHTDNNVLEGRSTCCGVEYSYTYNSAGYPITQAFGTGFATTTYTYHCETIP